ncbi:MAG: transcription-repair coupling factor, partial [Proteobacteria bacterium]|nr:transcription-repair coupling factor [Pseudomonadota bacterium]
ILKSTKAEKNIHILSVMGEFSNFVWFDQEKLLFIPEHSLFGIQEKTRKPRSRTLKNYLSSFRDLKTGDLVVHTQHGIGMYRGMVGMTVAGFSGDFLHLEYAGGDKIFLPADKLNLLQRYNSGSDSNAGQSHLDRLGSGGWERKKAKASQAIKDMAEKLLKLQAQRTLAPIHVYTSPSDDYFKFEAEFPFTETDDQLKAIQDVNSDLQSGKPMDRLICGDVGFGKTEVALRAIYRAVQEGFQVLVLVPTTILCYQHFRNFTDRLSKHGIRVAQLNRFVPSKAAKIVLEDMASGRIDVLVGTHKILGTKIAVKRLGMIVVDEEQRFGVTHKERLKELRAGADILTLTATPIPRTLHMAMLGLRDISIIATPPVSRVSVKTYIAEHDESLIKDAIEREISRNGQVFYVHNRVDDIAETTNYVKSLVPTARIKFAHGQMKETDLEDVILEFIEQRFDVLVCTTIIESGVDMPNVNTLIIDNSERFGLAQLYQMRGRVGRSSVQAFAYFLTNRISRLTDDAQKRLDVLASHQELGAGFQIASHDLEIRGAGNLLGADQSGHAAEVGLEMYTDLLAEAIAELRNENPPKKPTDPEIRLPISASILGSYIPTEGLRLQLYKNLFSSNSISSVDNLFNEALDRYGIMPVLTKKLFSIARIKTYLTSMNATQLIFISTQNVLEIRFTNLKELQIQHLIVEVQRQSKLLRLSPDYKLYINAASMQFWALSNDDSQLKSLEKLNELLGNLCTHQEQI